MSKLGENGTIQIYDISIDDFRDVTVEDVDRLEDVQQAYGRLRMAFAEIHEKLMKVWGVPL